ncbi:CRISPR-associated ring nuclease [Desulfobacterota bacterium M19]
MKNILLAVCGLAPQVITETIYALLHEGREINSVRVITTRQGRDRLLTTLFAPADSILSDLREGITTVFF